MTIITRFDLTAKDTDDIELRDFLSKILPDTRSFEGCQGAQFGVSLDSPNSVLLLEEWRSQADFETYLNWRVGTGDFAKLGSLLAGDPIVSHFECISIPAEKE